MMIGKLKSSFGAVNGKKAIYKIIKRFRDSQSFCIGTRKKNSPIFRRSSSKRTEKESRLKHNKIRQARTGMEPAIVIRKNIMSITSSNILKAVPFLPLKSDFCR